MEIKTHTKPVVRNFNKPGYILYLIAGIYFLVTKNISDAVIFWGIGLIFDPFNIAIPFPKRPFWQQAWLIIHLSITLALFVLMLVKK